MASEVPEPPPLSETVIDGWRLVESLDTHSPIHERFVVVAADGMRRALLTLYRARSEPDSSILQTLRRQPLAHVPEILGSGRWDDRAYDVMELITGGSLQDLGYEDGDSLETLHRIIDEIGKALASFAEIGLRHRDIRPGTILVRRAEPLDLVITGFGSARLSDFDLDIVSPLELTRYSAPETIVGGVSAASDWWSLGMILLERITHATCFAGVNEQAFMIHVVTRG
ncbi:MAG: protein kinase domain-containing protein, partial [Candidatus Entotheonellia bacterium]